MHINEELIRAFFLHQCTPAEAQKVRDYLEANPQEMEKYLPAGEWESADVKALLPDGFWDRQWEAILLRKNKPGIAVLLRRVAVAAVFLIAIGLSILYFVQKPSQSRVTITEAVPDFTTVTNTNKAVQIVYLPDSSVAELQPEAAITYKDGFEKTSRTIVLKGDAVFNVAKDRNRPFTVYSGNISTTALGTKFRVVYQGNGRQTKVHLIEGKVVVKVVNDASKKESYLLPGDLLSYGNNIVSVTRATEGIAVEKHQQAGHSNLQDAVVNKANADAPARAERKASGTVVIPQWYRFEKESLANVFDQLASLYNVKIEYDAGALKNKYFIGKFEQDKTIDKILITIAGLNHLEVEKIDDSHFRIK